MAICKWGYSVEEVLDEISLEEIVDELIKHDKVEVITSVPTAYSEKYDEYEEKDTDKVIYYISDLYEVFGDELIEELVYQLKECKKEKK